MIVKLLRYIKGCVYFKITNGIKEKFINLTASNNIYIWDMKNIPEGMTAKCAKKDWHKVKEYAKKTNVQIEITKETGLPQLTLRYKKRWGIVVGVIVFFAFLCSMQNFIWIIEFNGNDKLTEQRLLGELKDIGIKKGAYIPTIDFREKQQDAMLRISELGWISFNRQGSKVSVEISERRYAPEIMPQNPCNIVAKKTGQIKYVEIYNGEQVIKLNDTVSLGEVIVKGEIVNKKGETFYVHSDAKIIAEIQESKTFKINLNQTKKQYTDKVKKRNYIDFFGINIPLFIATKYDDKYDLNKSDNYLEMFSKKLPIGIKTLTYTFYDEISQSLSVEQAQEILKKSFNNYEKTQLGDTSITNRNITEHEQDGYYYMTIDYVYEEDIASKSEIKN